VIFGNFAKLNRGGERDREREREFPSPTPKGGGKKFFLYTLRWWWWWCLRSLTAAATPTRPTLTQTTTVTFFNSSLSHTLTFFFFFISSLITKHNITQPWPISTYLSITSHAIIVTTHDIKLENKNPKRKLNKVMDSKCGCWAVLKRGVRGSCKSSASRDSANAIPRTSLVYDAGASNYIVVFFISFVILSSNCWF